MICLQVSTVARSPKRCSRVRCPDSPPLCHIFGRSSSGKLLVSRQQKLYLLVEVTENNYKRLGDLGVVTETELKTHGRTHRRENPVNRSDRQPPASPSPGPWCPEIQVPSPSSCWCAAAAVCTPAIPALQGSRSRGYNSLWDGKSLTNHSECQTQITPMLNRPHCFIVYWK